MARRPARQPLATSFAALGAALVILALIFGTSERRGAAEPETKQETSVKYEINASGQTYNPEGSVDPNMDPDLIRVEATNGRVGYVESALMHHPPGLSVPVTEGEVEAYMSHPLVMDGWSLPVYEADGVTQVGEFHITGYRNSLKQRDLVAPK